MTQSLGLEYQHSWPHLGATGPDIIPGTSNPSLGPIQLGTYLLLFVRPTTLRLTTTTERTPHKSSGRLSPSHPYRLSSNFALLQRAAPTASSSTVVLWSRILSTLAHQEKPLPLPASATMAYHRPNDPDALPRYVLWPISRKKKEDITMPHELDTDPIPSSSQVRRAGAETYS